MPYLRDPIDPGAAMGLVRSRVAARDERFLAFARDSMLADDASPHRRLLEIAGWDYSRLAGEVRRGGLEEALIALSDQGVWTSQEEFRCQQPIERGATRLRPATEDFDNPRLRRSVFKAATGGTASGKRATVAYGWDLFVEEAALECLLFEAHGCLDAAWALWLPGLPSISGIHNVLVHLGFRQPPQRWFSHLPSDAGAHAALRYLQLCARAVGLRVPSPQPTSPQEASRVALWLSQTARRDGKAVLKTFASSAVRVAESARRLSLDLSGTIIFAGGEPLTERRRTHVEATGARVFGRYVATETGWIGAACPLAPSPSHLHFYSDRLAVIPGPEPGRLLFSTISPTSGKQLLNTDLGDAGSIGSRPCACPLGRAGLKVELSEIHSPDKVSAEGITLVQVVIEQAIEDAITEIGGPPDAFHLRERESPAGEARLEISLDPSLDDVSDRELIDAVLARLPERGPAADLAAQLWRRSGSVRISREHPALTSAMKLPPGARRG